MEIEKEIEVNLNWENIKGGLSIGTFYDDEHLIEQEDHSIMFTIDMTVKGKFYLATFPEPCEFDELDMSIEISNLEITDMQGNELDMDEDLQYEIEQQIIDKVTYE